MIYFIILVLVLGIIAISLECFRLTKSELHWAKMWEEETNVTEKLNDDIVRYRNRINDLQVKLYSVGQENFELRKELNEYTSQIFE